MDLVRPRSTSATQGGTASPYSPQAYSRPTTSHGPAYRTKDRLRQFHRLSAYQSVPEMKPRISSEAPTDQPPPLSVERPDPSPNQHEKTEPSRQMKRRKSNTVKTSFRKLFGRSSPASADEISRAEGGTYVRDEMISGSISQAQRGGSLPQWPTQSIQVPRQYSQPNVNTLGSSFSAPHSSRQSHDDADYSPQADYARRRNRLQRPRTAKGLGPSLAIEENDSNVTGRAVPTLPPIVSPVDDTATNVDQHLYDNKHSNPPSSPPRSPPRQRKPTSRRHVKDSLDTSRERYGSNREEISGITRGLRSPAHESWGSPAGEVALTAQQVVDVDPWSQQTAPRQVMEATSLAARITELEKRLAEMEYSVHKLTRVLLERSPNQPAPNDSRDSGPYLTPPSSQHENVSADAARPAASSRSSSKKLNLPSSPKSPTSLDDPTDVDQETTPRATFLASPSIDELGQYISPGRTQRPLHRTASAEDLNAKHIQTPSNTFTASTSALHQDLTIPRATLSSPTVHVLDAFHARPDSNATASYSQAQTTLPSPAASPTTPRYHQHFHGPTRDETIPYNLQQQTLPPTPISRWSAYETDADSINDYKTPLDHDEERAADADAEDNNTTPFSTAFSTERSSLEELRSSPAYHHRNRLDSRGLPPLVSITSINSSSRPTTAGAIDSMSSTSARGNLRARSAVDRVLAASERRRNDELKAFLDAGPPRGRGDT